MRNNTLTIILFLTIHLFTSCNIKLEPAIVDANKYLGNKVNSPDIYHNDTDKVFVSPFNFGHTDFGRLILISIDNHPTIKTVELVLQKDKKGAFVVIYYQNGKVETYINPYITLNRKYLKPNSDWEIAGVQDFDYDFEHTKYGLHVTLDIKIKTDEYIQIKLKENRKNLEHYSFLAPIGADLSEVKRFPFIYLTKSGFIPVENTEIDFKINNKAMQISKVPIAVEGKKCYKIAYALEPLPFFWNEERHGNIKTENRSENVDYEFTDNSGFKEIKKLTYNANNHKATYSFSPSFPLIFALKNNIEINGKYTMGIDKIDGVIGGKYTIKKKNEEIFITFKPKQCWQPMPGKDWVSAYQYNAVIKRLPNDSYNIKSEWTINR